MAAADPRVELSTLVKFVRELETHYLQRHLKSVTLAPPSRAEELDVAAFSVLVHGAMENYIEGLAVWALEKIETNWIFKKKANISTATLLSEYPQTIDHSKETKIVFDLVRIALTSAKSSHSKIIKDNNGVASKHLELLTPLGIDVPNDPLLTGSLDSLINMRHQWAHQSRFGAKITKTASDAKQAAKDCLQLAKEIQKNITALKL